MLVRCVLVPRGCCIVHPHDGLGIHMGDNHHVQGLVAVGHEEMRRKCHRQPQTHRRAAGTLSFYRLGGLGILGLGSLCYQHAHQISRHLVVHLLLATAAAPEHVRAPRILPLQFTSPKGPQIALRLAPPELGLPRHLYPRLAPAKQPPGLLALGRGCLGDSGPAPTERWGARPPGGGRRGGPGVLPRGCRGAAGLAGGLRLPSTGDRWSGGLAEEREVNGGSQAPAIAGLGAWLKKGR
mmetsp:Transcript_77670/g.177858  ORF Transcript_77670/g.177858 Transcript_77670/m.177858 type:complete len:238 (+) Transcript_77670:530-1243(+)